MGGLVKKSLRGCSREFLHTPQCVQAGRSCSIDKIEQIGGITVSCVDGGPEPAVQISLCDPQSFNVVTVQIRLHGPAG